MAYAIRSPGPTEPPEGTHPHAYMPPTCTFSKNVDGYADLTGNHLGGAATEVSRVGTFTKPPHSCTAEPASWPSPR